jgi:hypothetical protein
MSFEFYRGASDCYPDDMVENDHWALDVSDYVSGRLDPLAARDIERRAKVDGRLAAAIIDAKTVQRRVEKRLAL